MPWVCVSRRRATWLVEGDDQVRLLLGVQREAARRRDERLLAEQHGVAAGLGQRAPLRRELLPEPLGGGADGAGGGHRAPGHPAAPLEEARPAPRRAPPLLTSSGRDRICGPACSTTRQSAIPQQCRPVTACGSMVASALDTRSIVRFGSSGKPGCIAAVRPGSSRNITSGAIGAVSCAAATRVRARARTADPATEKARRGRHAEVEQRDAERHRAGELQLDRRAPSGHRAEERSQPDEGLAVDPDGGERRARIEASGRRARATRQGAPARRRCPTPPGRSSAPCPTGWAATAPPGGGAGAPARRWPRRAGRCAAGCRSSWPRRAEGRGPSRVARAPKPLLSPWSGQPENGHRRCAWANLSGPCTSSPAPGPPAPPGRCCPC